MQEKMEKDNYLVNPIDGDLSKLKNTTIFTGTNDILNPDVYVFKRKGRKIKYRNKYKKNMKMQDIYGL